MLLLLLLKTCILLRAESVLMLWDALHKQFLRESFAALAPLSANLTAAGGPGGPASVTGKKSRWFCSSSSSWVNVVLVCYECQRLCRRRRY